MGHGDYFSKRNNFYAVYASLICRKSVSGI